MNKLQELIALAEGCHIEFKIRINKSQPSVANKLKQIMMNKEGLI
jgi:hypothetical protein